MVTTELGRKPIFRATDKPWEYNGNKITQSDLVYADKDGHKGLFIEVTLESGEKVSQIWDWGTKPDNVFLSDIAMQIAWGITFMPWWTILDIHMFRESL